MLNNSKAITMQTYFQLVPLTNWQACGVDPSCVQGYLAGLARHGIEHGFAYAMDANRKSVYEDFDPAELEPVDIVIIDVLDYTATTLAYDDRFQETHQGRCFKHKINNDYWHSL